MKCKVIQHYTCVTQKMEKEINVWLNDNPFIDINHISSIAINHEIYQFILEFSNNYR